MDDAQPQSPVREGDVLAGKYLVEKVLGVGGMGVVVAAMHTELDQRVALKFLQPAAAQNPSVVARFNREARAAAKIKSQHVARVIDVGSLDNGTPYIVMEYLDGQDLSDLLEAQGRLAIGVAVDYLLQASEAIAEAHAVGFIHRDLKPPNLFLAHQSDGSSIIKVLDFGISKAVIADEPTSNRGALTGTSEIFGSPMYMSPEQLKSARDVDARADIWAMGVILYELISGHAPFDRPTVAETFGAILYEQPVPLRKVVPEIPAELERIILRCLEKDKAGRLSNVAELAQALLPFAASATRASLDRTSRVLRRAGVMVESVPPPPMGGAPSGPRAQARTSVGTPSGAQTGTGWDTASQVPTRPRSGSRVTLFVGVMAGVILSGGAGFMLLRRQPPRVTVSMTAEKPASLADAAKAPAAGRGDTAPSLPVVDPAAAVPTPVATAATTTATGAVAVAPTVTPVATGDAPKAGDAPKPPVLGPRGKLSGRLGKAAPSATATAGAAAPVKPAAKAGDGDDFGDRK